MADDDKADDHDFYDPHAAKKQASGLYEQVEFNKIKRSGELNLVKKDPTLKNIIAALGWDFRSFDRDPPDLDASVFLLGRNEKTREDSDFIFYNSLTGCEGAVRHTGDSRTGAGEGDDETVMIDLVSLPFDVAKIVFAVSIYDLDMSENNFTHVKNVYFRLINPETGYEMVRYELTEEDLNTAETGMIVAEIERMGSEWIFRALCKPVKGGLAKIAHDYGIMVQQIITT